METTPITTEQKQTLSQLINTLDTMGCFLAGIASSRILPNNIRAQFQHAAIGMAQTVTSLEAVQRLSNGLPAYEENHG